MGVYLYYAPELVQIQSKSVIIPVDCLPKSQSISLSLSNLVGIKKGGFVIHQNPFYFSVFITFNVSAITGQVVTVGGKGIYALV